MLLLTVRLNYGLANVSIVKLHARNSNFGTWTMKPPRKGSIQDAANKTAVLLRGGTDALNIVAEILKDSQNYLEIKVSERRRKQYTEAAKKAGLSLNVWLLKTLDAAS